MNIKQGKNRFYVGDSVTTATAEMSYVPTGDNLLIIDHTYVSEELKGQGVAKLLLNEVVEYARNENLKIIPLCPYAAGQMKDNEEYADVLAN